MRYLIERRAPAGPRHDNARLAGCLQLRVLAASRGYAESDRCSTSGFLFPQASLIHKPTKPWRRVCGS